MSIFDRLKQYYADRSTYREARDMEAQSREQAASARRQGDTNKALKREYEAETQRRRKEAAKGRISGLD